MSLVQVQNAESTPINGQARYSSANGTFNIVFELTGGPNMMIDLNSLRLLANVDYLKSNGQHFNNFNIYGNNIDPSGGNVAAGGVLPAYTEANNEFYDTDSRTGVANCISSILFQDAESNTLEAVYSYPHLMNKVIPMTMSKADNLTWGSAIYGLKSGGRQLQNQYSLNSRSQLAIKIYCGLCQSKPMPYVSVRGKMKITITLNAAASALFGGANTGANFGVGGASNPSQGAYFNLDNVRIVYRNLILDEQAPILKAGYQFKHFSSLQSTINNSNNQNIYNPNNTNAISVLTSFVRSGALNSYNANSVQSNKLQRDVGGVPTDCDIQTTNFLKNNVRFPNVFGIEEGVYNENNNGFKNYDTQRSYYFMSTLTPLSMLNNTLIQPSTEGSGTNQCGGFTEFKEPDQVPVYGVGIRYGNVSLTDGTNFTGGQSFLQRIESELNGSMPNEMFTNVLATKRIVPSPSGPIVLA